MLTAHNPLAGHRNTLLQQPVTACHHRTARLVMRRGNQLSDECIWSPTVLAQCSDQLVGHHFGTASHDTSNIAQSGSEQSLLVY